MKTKKLLFVAMLWALLAAANQTYAQGSAADFLNVLRLEARADFEFDHLHTHTFGPMGSGLLDENPYGFSGKYFNIHMGGDLGGGFTYYYRQRIVANGGSVKFFDNTDFLYLNYVANKNWSFRLGKDALTVGGYEYDAAPIDVLFNGYYWDWYYCFQLAASAAYHSNNGNHTLMFQVATSPYSHTGSAYGEKNLLAYNLYWSGNMKHFHTLYSIGVFEREQGTFVGNVALGNKLVYDKWDWYVDLMSRCTSTSQLTSNWSVISRFGIHANDNLTVFVKGGYEQNKNEEEWDAYVNGDLPWDCLAMPGQTFGFYGAGVEYRPAKCKDVRFHAFVANFETGNATTTDNAYTDVDLRVNVGLTWNMNILKMLNKVKK